MLVILRGKLLFILPALSVVGVLLFGGIRILGGLCVFRGIRIFRWISVLRRISVILLLPLRGLKNAGRLLLRLLPANKFALIRQRIASSFP